VTSSAESLSHTGCFPPRDSRLQWPSEVCDFGPANQAGYMARISNPAIATLSCLANVFYCCSQAYDCSRSVPNRCRRLHHQLSPRCERRSDSFGHHRSRKGPQRGSASQRGTWKGCSAICAVCFELNASQGYRRPHIKYPCTNLSLPVPHLMPSPTGLVSPPSGP
jgi:hypothetical protein